MSAAVTERMLDRLPETADLMAFTLADAEEMMRKTAFRRLPPPPEARVYLLHFDQPFGSGRQFCRHYIGSAYDVHSRVKRHATGKSDSKFMRHVIAAGVKIVLARTWPGGRDLERRLKKTATLTGSARSARLNDTQSAWRESIPARSPSSLWKKRTPSTISHRRYGHDR